MILVANINIELYTAKVILKLFICIFQRRFFERLILTFIYLAILSVAIYLRPASELLVYTEPKDAVSYVQESTFIMLFLEFLGLYHVISELC